MPTNKTQNYQLNQWVKSDQVLMEDFNDDNAKIDAALKAHDTSLASKASTSALNSLKTTVNGKASTSALNSLQTTVNTKASQSALDTLSATVAQHTSALTGKGNCEIYTTSYTGNNETSKTLTFSKPPQVVIVGGGNGVLVLVRGAGSVPGLCGSFYLNNVSWSGNSVTWSHSGSGGASGALNYKGTTYYVAALLKAS